MEDNHYQLLDGKAVSAQMKKEMAEEVAQIKAAGGKIPHLAAILVGHDGGSETYVASKVKTCEEIGFKSTLIRYEDDVTEEILSIQIPKIVVPVTGGRSMSAIIEAAVMNMQLKDSGFDSSKEFVNRILDNIKSKS